MRDNNAGLIMSLKEWESLSVESRAKINAYGKDFENTIKRLASLRELWRAAPAGTREFVGHYGPERAAWLREFESALNGDL